MGRGDESHFVEMGMPENAGCFVKNVEQDYANLPYASDHIRLFFLVWYRICWIAV